MTTRHSYDLDMDTKLAEETTVLMENYTVRSILFPLQGTYDYEPHSYQMVVSLKWAQNDSKLRNVCSSPISLTLSSLALLVSFPQSAQKNLILCYY